MRIIALALAFTFAAAPAFAKKHHSRAHKVAKHKAKRGRRAHASLEPAAEPAAEPAEPSSVTIPPQHAAPAPTPISAAPVSQADDDEVPGQGRRH